MNTLKNALHGITGNKLRAALTTLGIIIGVASVIAMLALGNGARAAVAANFRFLGADIIQLSAKTKIDQGELVPTGQILSYEDGLQMVEAVPLVTRVDMTVAGQGKVRYERTVLDMGINGVTAAALQNFASSANLQPVGWPLELPLRPDAFLAEGRFFSPVEVVAAADVCVLGHKTAVDLFAGSTPLDELITVNRKRCQVIGVLAELETVDPAERGRSRPNELVMMPISTAIRNLFEREPSVQIAARISDESQMRTAGEQVKAYLRERHAIEQDENGAFADDFELLTRQEVLGAQLAAARTFSLLLAAMATVSLIVGGIGIMNVMLVSVTERTREIGILMAIGARPQDIIAQFLLESVLISCSGGILGIALGIWSIPLAAVLNQGNALLAAESIPLAFGVSLLVGILFGIYPAIRAARLDPIEALRYE